MENAQSFNAIPMEHEHINFVFEIKFCESNKAALHGAAVDLDECECICHKNLHDPDEANFIIRKGIVPVAWLKINGLQNTNRMAWISMLVVHEKFQRHGIGSFAVRFAEDFVRSKGFQTLGIHTTADNIAAQSCYQKLGYRIHEESECTTGDGVKRHGLSLHRDNLDAVRMHIDGVSFHLKEQHDFSFISKIGKVFRVFDAMDSGNICFGAQHGGKRYFVKYAGAKTQNYNGEIADAVTRLQNAVRVYRDLQHPYLIRLLEHYPAGNGYVAVFDWVNGEGLRSYWNYIGQAMWSCPASPNYRFRHLPVEKRIAVVDKIMEFHQHVIRCGYIPADFYDGSMIYDFDNGDFHICDIDFYRKSPAKNDMGKMWGSTRFMSPEEYMLGADLDEKTVVYLMGAAAFALLGNDTQGACQAWENGKPSRSFNAWSAAEALFDVATKAASPERSERYHTIAELVEMWNSAKTADCTTYLQLPLGGNWNEAQVHHQNMLFSDNMKNLTFTQLQKGNKKQKRTFRRIYREYAMHLQSTSNKRLIAKVAKSIWDKQGPSDRHFELCCNNGKLIGFLYGKVDHEDHLGFIKPGYGYVMEFYVRPAFRRKGYGTAMFLRLESLFAQDGVRRMYLNAEPATGEAFWPAMGFVLTGEVSPENHREIYEKEVMEFVL